MNKRLLHVKMTAFLSSIPAYPVVAVTTETVSQIVIENILRWEIILFGIQELVSNYFQCLDHCPCYIECYFGCPCPYESPYCYECEDKNENQFMDCKSRILSIMDDCIEHCEPFNESCDTDCFIDYHNMIKVVLK